jgi:Phage P22-like portal protein
VPQPPINFTEQADTDAEIFMEASERLRIAEEIESPNRLLAIEDLEFEDGQQWPDDIYNLRKVQRRPSLTINHTATLVRRVTNNMREQRPRIKVHPVSDATIDDARVANGLVRHVETLSKASVAYDTAGASAVRIGWGYARVVGDYVSEKEFEQELYIRPIRNALTCYIDPGSVMPDGSDADWFLITEWMKKTAFKRAYPDEPLTEWTHGAPGDDQHKWENKESIRLAEYYRIKRTKDTLYKLSNGNTVFASEYRKRAQAFELAKITILDNRPSERRQVQWFRLTGAKVAERRDLPGRWIPISRCEGNVLDLNGDVRRKGMIRDMKDPARSANYWETAKAEKLALTSKAPYIAAEGQTDGHPEWDDANQKPYSILKYKLILGMDGQPLPVPPPQRQAPAEVEAGFKEAAESSLKNLMMIAGMPHEPGQDTPGTVVSGVALRKRQAISDISHFQFYDNQTMFISHIGEILLDLFPYYYSEQRMQRIIGEDGTPQMVQINQPQVNDQGVQEIKHNMSVGRYDVVMDTGPGYETKRQEGAENMLDLLKTPLAEPIAKTGADLVVRNMDFAGADDLADRLMPLNQQGMSKAMENLPHSAKGIVQALMIQSQEQQKTIQQLQLEIKYKMQIEQGWMQVDREKALGANVTKVHDTEKRSQTALDVAELKAGADIIDSRQSDRHEKGMAEREMEHAEHMTAAEQAHASSESDKDRKAAKAKPANGQGK